MSGLLQRLGWDEPEEKLIVETIQDVEPILEHNKALLNDGDGYTPSRELRRAASIPNIVVHQWLQEGINVFDRADWPKVAARLDSPEWAHLRTAPGRLSKAPVREYLRASTASKHQG